MALYATEQDMVDLYSFDEMYLAFARDGASEIDESALDAALQRASDEIDAYLAARYDLPLSTVPSVLVQLCVDIALYKGSVGSAQTEEKRIRYNDAVKLLTQIAAGKASLNLPADDQPDVREEVTVDAADKIFPRDVLEKY